MNALLSPLCYAIGYLAGLAAFCAMARRRGIATSGIAALAGAGVIGGLVGAHLAQWILGGSEGKSVLGAISFGYLAVAWYKRHLGITRPTGDLFAVALCAGEAIGRFGCFFGGCCGGIPTHVPWAVWQDGAWRHPSQVYDALAWLLIGAILLRIERTYPRENTLFYVQGLLYSTARFGIEFFRAHPTPPTLGLSVAQWACVAGAAFFSARLGLLLHTPMQKATAHAPLPELQPVGR